MESMVDAEAAVDAGAGAAAGAPGRSPPVRLELTAEQRQACDRLLERLAAPRFGAVLLEGVTASGKTEIYMRAAERAIVDDGQALVLVPEISISVQLLDCFEHRFGARVRIYHSELSDTQRRATWKAVQDGDCRILVGARSALFGPFRSLRLVVVDEEHETAYKQNEQPRYHARDAAVQRARLNEALVVLGSATPSLESAHNAEVGRYEHVRLGARVDARPLATIELADLRVLDGARRAELDAERRRRRDQVRRARLWERFARLERSLGRDPGERPENTMPLEERPVGPPPSGTDTGVPPGARAATGDGDQRPAPAEPDHISPRLLAALEEVVGRREQAILLVGRRGFSTFVQCTECGQVSRCPSCEVALVYHAAGHQVRCHHCGLRQAAAERCPLCEGTRFWHGGVGTQRVEAELRRRLPDARVLRMDLDTTRRAGSHRRIVSAFADRQADVLLGTQMVAKGLHFPEVTLVGVVSADSQLNLPDFRAGERTFQLLTQVAGRAGRGRIPGRVIIQSRIPDHPAIVAALAQDFAIFYRQAIEERRELGYPPLGVMARFLIEGSYEEDVVQVGDRLVELLGTSGAASASLQVMGPAPLPLARLRRRHRWHVTLLGPSRPIVHGPARQALGDAQAAGLPARVRLHLDIDPVHLL
jgi:primosomal protein N' (replication factor Y)